MCLAMAVTTSSPIGIIASMFKVNVLPQKWYLLCRKPYKNGLMAWGWQKTLNRNSLDCSWALTVIDSGTP